MGPLPIAIGRGIYSEDVIVASIEDEMLLGLDFMMQHGVNINLPEDQIVLGNEVIPLLTETSLAPKFIARVTVKTRTVIPPNSVRLVPCQW